MAKCKECNASFIKLREVHEFCCRKCQIKNYNKKKSKKNNEPKILENCEWCGYLFPKNSNNKKKIFCSRKCQLEKYSALRGKGCRKNQKRCKDYHLTEEYKKNKSEYDSMYRILNKEKLTKKDKIYYENNQKKIRARVEKWRLENVGKIREGACLRIQFQTSKLPLSIKKNWALVHLGYRTYRSGCRNVSNKEISKILKNLNKGGTYIAYE